MRRFAVVIVLAALFLSPLTLAHAEELTPQKRADIERLFQVSGSEMVVRQVTAALTAQTVAILRITRKNLTQQQLAAAESEIRAVLQEKMGGADGILQRLTPLYAATFSEAEIQDMLKFYDSPTGKKVVAAMPGLNAAGQRIGLNMAKEIAPELKQRLEKILETSGQKNVPAK